MTTATETRIKITRALGKCRSCGAGVSRAVIKARFTNGRGRQGEQRFTWRNAWAGETRTVVQDSAGADCPSCGHRTPVVLLKATLNEDKACSARCQSATGHTCECSCGGANHGRAHG